MIFGILMKHMHSDGPVTTAVLCLFFFLFFFFSLVEQCINSTEHIAGSQCQNNQIQLNMNHKNCQE
jgi:hypothetical protein